MPEVIEMVKDAERRSEANLAAADAEAEKIIGDAKKAAERLVGDRVKAAADRAADRVAAAERENSALMDKSTTELNAEIQSLKNSANDKMAKAVDLVCGSIVHRQEA